MADPTNFQKFLDRGPDRDDFLARGIRKFRTGNQPVGQGARDLEATITGSLGAFGGTGIGLASANLNEILFNRGRTDRTAFNRDLRGIQRDTEAERQAFAGQGVSQGFQPGTSGARSAIDAAIGQTGLDREAAARANETELAEKRQREDIMAALEFFIKPGIQTAGIAASRDLGFSAQNSQERAALIGAIGQLFSPGG